MGIKILIQPPKKEDIDNLYWKEKLSQNEIAEIYNVARYTIQRWMWAYNIPRRPSGFTTERMRKKAGLLLKGKHNSPETEFKPKVNIPKNKLEQLYLKEKLSMRQIGKKYDISRKAIKTRLKKYDIPIRSTRKEYEELRIKRLHDDDVASRFIKSLMKRPTKPEQKFIDMTKKYNLPYKYVGDGEFILGGRCPDFLNYNGEKKVIEIFGRVFHDPEKSFFKISYKKTEEGTIKHYEKYGFKCIIIWEEELKNEKKVLNTIGDF